MADDEVQATTIRVTGQLTITVEVDDPAAVHHAAVSAYEGRLRKAQRHDADGLAAIYAGQLNAAVESLVAVQANHVETVFDLPGVGAVKARFRLIPSRSAPAGEA